jgi:CBS domain-containing protein
MAIGEFCSRDVVIADEATEVTEAARLMRQHHVGNLVVCERRAGLNHPVGIVTDRDLVVEVMAEGVSAADVTVGDVMSRDIRTALEGDDVWDVLQRMRDHGVRRMPVVDGQGALVGLVTLDDLLELCGEALVNMSRLIRGEIRRESRLRPG